MTEAQTPTLEDLSRLLATARGGRHHPEAHDTLLWLIEQSEAARSLHAELLAGDGETPTPMELARFLFAVASNAELPDTLETARWLIARSERAQALYHRLEQIAEDAGRGPIRPGRAVGLVEYERKLEQLLLATDDWQDPFDVLDPTRGLGFDGEAIHSLCRARLEQLRRLGEPPGRLEAVCGKLERPAEVERLLPLSDRRFERLREWLREVWDVDAAAGSLEEMARLLRSVQDSE